MNKVTALQRQIEAEVRNARALTERQVQAMEKQIVEAVKANGLSRMAVWISCVALLVSIAAVASVWLR